MHYPRKTTLLWRFSMCWSLPPPPYLRLSGSPKCPLTDNGDRLVLSATLMRGLGAIFAKPACERVGAFAVPLWHRGAPPIAIFAAIALPDQYPDRDWRRNSDLAVLLLSRCRFFRRCLHHFPLYHRGIMLLMVSITHSPVRG